MEQGPVEASAPPPSCTTDAATQSDFAERPARVLSDEDLLDDGLQEAGALCNDERLVVGEFSTLVAEGLLVFVVLGDKAGDAVGEVDQVFAQVFGFGVEFRFVTHEIAEDVHEDFEILGAAERQAVHVVGKVFAGEFVVGLQRDRRLIILQILHAGFAAEVFLVEGFGFDHLFGLHQSLGYLRLVVDFDVGSVANFDFSVDHEVESGIETVGVIPFCGVGAGGFAEPVEESAALTEGEHIDALDVVELLLLDGVADEDARIEEE